MIDFSLPGRGRGILFGFSWPCKGHYHPRARRAIEVAQKVVCTIDEPTNSFQKAVCFPPNGDLRLKLACSNTNMCLKSSWRCAWHRAATSGCERGVLTGFGPQLVSFCVPNTNQKGPPFRAIQMGCQHLRGTPKMESGCLLGFPSNRPKKATFDFEKLRFGGPRRSNQTPRGLPQRHRHPADSPGREVSNDTAKFGTHLPGS